MLIKQPIRTSFWPRGTVSLPLLFAILCTSLSVFLIPDTVVYAQAVPGGNIHDPVVRAVDVAKPAVVRIITTINGRIAVTFPDQSTVTFPLDGSSYQVQFSGSGAFISSHGDILTADHVVQPPHDASLDQALQTMAAQDIADYVNTHYPSTQMPYTAQDIYANLQYGSLPSQTSYSTPQSEIYLSQDYTGPSYHADKLSDVPSYAHMTIDKIEAQSPSNQHDVAIVHVNMNDTPSIHLDDSSNVAEQDQLTIIGFPGNGDLTSPQHGNETSFLTSSVNQIYVSALKTEDNGTPVIQVGGNIEHGDSGGPALDGQGNIVGIVSFSSADGDTPMETSFLQTSDSAQQLLAHTSINTTPGNFQTTWQHAFADYAATTTNHWSLTVQDLANMQRSYPHFGAVLPFLTYAQARQTEQAASSNQGSASVLITLFILLVLLGIGLFIYLRLRTARRLHLQAALSTPITHYPPASLFTKNPAAAPYAQEGTTSITAQPSHVPHTPEPQPNWQNYMHPVSIQAHTQSAQTKDMGQQYLPASAIIPGPLSHEDRHQTLQNIYGHDSPLLADQPTHKGEGGAQTPPAQYVQSTPTREAPRPFTDIATQPASPPTSSQKENENEMTLKVVALKGKKEPRNQQSLIDMPTAPGLPADQEGRKVPSGFSGD